MAPDPGSGAFEALVADLRALGASAGASARAEAGTEADRMADGVLARLAADGRPATEPAAGPSWRARLAAGLARRRRRLVVACVVVVLTLTGVPAVRAAVADWFGFAGVRVRLDPGAPTPPPSGTVPPRVTAAASLQEAQSLVDFTVLAPSALGVPEGVEVSADRRVVSMSWTVPDAGVVRLDQFDGGLDYVFAKTAGGVEYTTVNGAFALWFDRPHAVAWLAGTEPSSARTQPPRLAAHTLIWEQDGTTLRLEGDLTRDRAREVGATAVPVPR